MRHMTHLMEADRLARLAQDVAQGVLIVGKVAAEPDKVKDDTVLDLLVVGEMRDLGKAYAAFKQREVKGAVRDAEEGMIDMATMSFSTDACKVWVHYWSPEAFDNVCDLDGWNWFFKASERVSRNEILKNSYGKTIVMSHRVHTQDGVYIGAFPAYKNGSLYLGPQAMNLALKPKIITDHGRIEEGLDRLKHNLRREGENIECLLR